MQTSVVAHIIYVHHVAFQFEERTGGLILPASLGAALW